MSFRSKNSGRALLPFGLDYSDVLSTDASKEKPTLELPINGSLNTSEISIAKQSIAFSNILLEGPFYTGSTIDTNPEKKTTSSDGIERYSDKYKKVNKVGRTIEEHPYQLELFPDELYSVMGISNKQKKKLLSLSSFKTDGGLTDFTVNETDESNAQSMLEKLKNMADNLETDPNANNKEEVEEEDDGEDDFEEDEEDDDDYNAEKYFDDGDEEPNDDGDDEAAF